MATGIHYWPRLLDMAEDQCRVKLRCMEIEAYSCIVAVLRARGPLTEEKLSFMKQCAKEFHISQERHKVEIRKASNSELLSTIAEMLYGPNTETKWFIEGRRLAPIINLPPRQSIYIELANRMAALARAHNAGLPAYSEYKDEPVEVENLHLKDEEEVFIQELEAQVKAREEELKKATPTPLPIIPTELPLEPTEVSMECHETMPVESQSTQDSQQEIVEVLEHEQMVEIKENDNSYVLVEEVEQIEQGGVEIKKLASPRNLEPVRGSLSKSPSREGIPHSREKISLSTPARKKKRSLSIEKYDGTPPKRFSNVAPPRIPATPVSQRPPRFQTSQPSPRIMVVPGSMQQPHSSMTHINTVRKPVMKTLHPPIISKIQRNRLYSTPIRNLHSHEILPGPKTIPAKPLPSNVSPKSIRAPSPKTVPSKALSAFKPLPPSSFPPKSTVPYKPATTIPCPKPVTSSLLFPSPRAVGPTSGVTFSAGVKNGAPGQKKPPVSGPPVKATLSQPSKKEPSKMSKPASTSTSITPGAKSVILKSGSSSQGNVFLVDITQDHLSGNLSVEELLKASGISNAPATTANTKSANPPLPNIIKLQNPKSLGSLPANIQQIKIIKSSGSKFVLTTSANCTMETVLSLAQSSSSPSSPIFTPSSSSPISTPNFSTPISNPRPSSPISTSSNNPSSPSVFTSISSSATNVPSTLDSSIASSILALTSTSTVPISTPTLGSEPRLTPKLVSTAPLKPTPKLSLPAPITTPKVVPSSIVSPKTTAFSVLTPRSTPSFTPRPRPPVTRTPVTTPPAPSSTSSGGFTTGSHLANWLSNYVVSDKDIEDDSDDGVLFGDPGDKM